MTCNTDSDESYFFLVFWWLVFHLDMTFTAEWALKVESLNVIPPRPCPFLLQSQHYTASQHTKLTLKKKILPQLLLGFKLTTFQLWVWHSNQQAIPAPGSYLAYVPPLVTAMARKRPWSFCQKCRWQVTPKHIYTLDPMKSELADFAAVSLGIVWEPIRKRAHMQLIRKQSVTVISARWATVDWFWPKEWS